MLLEVWFPTRVRSTHQEPNPKKSYSPSSRNYGLLMTPQLRVELCGRVLSVLSCSGHVHTVTVAVSSYVHLCFCVLQTLVLSNYLPPLLWSFYVLSIKRRVVILVVIFQAKQSTVNLCIVTSQGWGVGVSMLMAIYLKIRAPESFERCINLGV